MTFNFTVKEFIIGNGTPTLQFYRRGFDLQGNGSTPEWQDIILSGNTALTLVNSKEDGLNYLKLFGGTELLPETYLDTVTLDGATVQRNLPSEYTQVESLANTSDAYIETSISLDDNDEIEFWWNAEARGSVFAFSQGASADNKAFQLANTDATGIVFDVRTYNPYRINTNVQAYNNGVKHILIKNREIFIDGVSYGTSQGSVTNPTDILRLFISSANSVTPSKFTNRFTVKNKINLIFCRRNSDSVLGMYDTVSGNFLTNQGTGDFIAGADVVVPSPTNPMDIVCNNGVLKVSKNLFDNSTLYNWFFTNGVITYKDGRYAKYMRISSSETYIISRNDNYNVPLRIVQTEITPDAEVSYNIDGTTTFVAIESNQFPYTFTSRGSAKFLVFSADSSLTEAQAIDLFNKLQVELGSTATTYMPYGQIYTDGTTETVKDSLNNTAVAEMLLSVGDVKDVQSVLDGVITKNVGILILDGTESWQVATGTGFKQFYSTNTQGIIANSVSLMSNIAPYGCTASTRANYDYGCYSGGNGNLCFQMIGSSTINTTTDWTNYLSEQYANGTPVIIVYPLATTTTETVSGQLLQKSPVTQTAGAISNLGIAVTSSSHTTPTPTQPLPINCNNGVLGVDNQGNITVTGTQEKVEVDTTGDSTLAEMLLAVGSYQDEQNVTTGDITRKVGIKVLDGTENWAYDSQYSRFSLDENIGVVNTSVPRSIPAFCTHYSIDSSQTPIGNLPDNTGYIGSVSGGVQYSKFWVHTSAYNDATNYKAFLASEYQAGQPVIIVYPLATPTTETVTGQPMNIQAGTNIVEITEGSIDGLELEVSYKATV